MITTLYKTCFIFLSVCTMSACIASNNHTPSMTKDNTLIPIMPEVIYSGNQCNISQAPSTVWITSAQQLEDMLKRVNRNKIAFQVEKLPNVNYINEGVVLIAMGQQRTGGYSITLGNEPMRLNGQIATLPIQWNTPAAGMILTQALTSPCLFVKVNKANYRTLHVVTQTGQVIDKIDLQPK